MDLNSQYPNGKQDPHGPNGKADVTLTNYEVMLVYMAIHKMGKGLKQENETLNRQVLLRLGEKLKNSVTHGAWLGIKAALDPRNAR